MKNPFIILLFSLLMSAAAQAQAHEMILDPQHTRIAGSIPYTELGTYKAAFHDFSGKLIVDQNGTVQSVYLKIKVKSIHSTCDWCDDLACSRRLLNAVKFPWIIFKSEKITTQDKIHYQVVGILEMHGIAKRMSFPFRYEGRQLTGRWRINRKDFKIIWNKTLDHGGVVVGDYLTVAWGIK